MKELLFFPLHEKCKEDFSSLYINRGFLYGDGFFETMRISKGSVPFFNDHCNRIIKTLDALKFRHAFNAERLLQDIASSISHLGFKQELRCRLTFFRMGQGYYTPLSSEPAMLMQVMQIPEYSFNSKGLEVCLYEENFKSLSPLSGYKTVNCLVYILAGIFASGNGCNDALLINSKGNIIEATSSNIFIYKDSILATPPLAEGCVDGIIRRNLMRNSLAIGINCVETPITLNDLISADELLLTNAISLVQYVKSGLNKSYSGEFASKMFNRLQQYTNSVKL